MLDERTSDHVTWCRLERPERLNAFTAADYRDLRCALERATVDPDSHVIVLTGTGRAFSAGADRSLFDGTPRDPDQPDPGEEFELLLAALGACEKPLVAAVNGMAVGIGCTILLHCDLVLAAESARFRLPFTSLGIVPEAGSSTLIPAQLRRPDAIWALLSSEWFDAVGAAAMGLVWRIVPDDDLVAATTEVAAQLAALDPASVAATKRLVTAGRADAVRLAHAREVAAMGELLGHRSAPSSSSPSPHPSTGPSPAATNRSTA